jgi:hypothetical protein
MKYLLVLVALLSCAAAAQTRYTNIDDSTLVDNGSGTGWGSCVDCAGGGNNNATIASSPFQNPPSTDGASRDFYINGSAYSDALWWYKLGANDAVSNFRFDFWLNVNSSVQQNAQALEFDTFQFISGKQYMFGTQCNFFAGTWDVWNASAGAWVHSAVPCRRFNAGNWYHITLSFHRSSDGNEHYDSLVMAQYNPLGRPLSQNMYVFNQVLPGGTLPPGWGENLGVQFQMDIGATGTTMQEWVDQVSLTAW